MFYCFHFYSYDKSSSRILHQKDIETLSKTCLLDASWESMCPYVLQTSGGKCIPFVLQASGGITFEASFYWSLYVYATTNIVYQFKKKKIPKRVIEG